MSDEGSLEESLERWRMPETLVWIARVVGVGFALFAVVAIGHDLANQDKFTGATFFVSIIAAVALLGFPLLLWFFLIRPHAVANEEGLVIRNPFNRRMVSYSEIRAIRPEDAFVGFGPTLMLEDGSTVRVWALQGIIRRLLFKEPSRSDLFIDEVAALEARTTGGVPRDLHDPLISISPRGRITLRPREV